MKRGLVHRPVVRRPRPARRNVQRSLQLQLHSIRMLTARARSRAMARGKPGFTACGARLQPLPQPSQE